MGVNRNLGINSVFREDSIGKSETQVERGCWAPLPGILAGHDCRAETVARQVKVNNCR